jgi:hypothetical protein
MQLVWIPGEMVAPKEITTMFEVRDMESGPVVWIPREMVTVEAFVRAICQLGGDAAFVPTDTDDFEDEDVLVRVSQEVVGAIERAKATADGVLTFYKASEVTAGIYGLQFKDGLAVLCAATIGGKTKTFPSYAEMCVFVLNNLGSQ